jgi:hypothetical protein
LYTLIVIVVNFELILYAKLYSKFFFSLDYF